MLRSSTPPFAAIRPVLRPALRPAAARLLLALTLLGAAGLGLGCNTVGPKAVRDGRFDYNQALATTWNEQLLLNLVRLKYRDTPFFLDVSSVSTQYELRAAATVSASVSLIDTDSGGNEDTGVSILERPTVSYTPMGGDEFVKSLMTPVSLETVMLLPRSGWSVDRVMRLVLQRVNDLDNASSASGPTPSYVPRYEEFQRMGTLLRTLQIRGQLALRVPTAQDSAYALRLQPEAAASPEGRELLDLLGVEASPEGLTELPFTFDILDPEPGQLTLAPRSLLGTLYYLSQGVQVPPEHREAGLVTRTLTEDGREFDWSRVVGDLFQVRWSEGRPDRAFVSVRYRGAWFYIDDRDLDSKSTFSLLSLLFSLQAGDSNSLAPVLTLGLGGS